MIKNLRFSVIQSKVFGFLYLSETEQKHTIRGNGVKITRILSKKKKIPFDDVSGAFCQKNNLLQPIVI